jgi:hypothetical protein
MDHHPLLEEVILKTAMKFGPDGVDIRTIRATRSGQTLRFQDDISNVIVPTTAMVSKVFAAIFWPHDMADIPDGVIPADLLPLTPWNPFRSFQALAEAAGYTTSTTPPHPST